MLIGLMWLIMLFGEMMNPGDYYRGAGEKLQCYLPFYAYSGVPGYIAAICSSADHAIAMVRITGPEPLKVSYNHTGDLLAFSVILASVIMAWTLYIYRKVGLYVPGL